MSTGSKARSALKRKIAKAKAKADKKARYASFAALGRNGVGKRSRIASRKRQGRSPFKHMHRMADCGNIGCKECNP